MTLDAMLTPPEPESAVTVTPSRPRRHRHIWRTFSCMDKNVPPAEPTHEHGWQAVYIRGGGQTVSAAAQWCAKCGELRDSPSPEHVPNRLPKRTPDSCG